MNKRFEVLITSFWKSLIIGFKDLFDLGANNRETSLNGLERLKIVGAGLFAIVSFFEAFHEVLSIITGIHGRILAFLLAIVTILICLHIIVTKEKISSPSISNKEYKFDFLSRQISKLLLALLLLISVPQHIRDLNLTYSNLPVVIYGYLLDARTRRPIKDANVRVLDFLGVDVTEECWTSDDSGFYILKIKKGITRRAKIIVYQPNCEESTLELKKEFETEVDPVGKQIMNEQWPSFIHHITCK